MKIEHEVERTRGELKFSLGSILREVDAGDGLSLRVDLNFLEGIHGLLWVGERLIGIADLLLDKNQAEFSWTILFFRH